MSNPFDVRVVGAQLYFLPVETRVPLKFGSETLTSVTCARVALTVECSDGRKVTGWGETPLNVQWVWPSDSPYEPRHEVLKQFTMGLARCWAGYDVVGHPVEIGHAFETAALKAFYEQTRGTNAGHEMPWLAALVCCSAFDIALHDAYGKAHNKFIYDTYKPPYMNKDLGQFLKPAEGGRVDFNGQWISDYLARPKTKSLPVWHLVGGKDWIDGAEDDGSGPDDGYPVLLRDWIRRDGLKCLKIKLRGNDAAWDYDRILQVGQIAIEEGVDWLTTDFNCTVHQPSYVNAILDRLVQEAPRIYGMILYVEQPFPYELEEYPIDVHSVSARKPLFMDESAHDWELVKRGRSLGWTGVALKTCKTQTGALLALCWAKAHGMTLMVQDLTNPMLAQMPHVLLAAHAGTIMGVESNGMQFYPEASAAEAAIHPGLYTRRDGALDWSTLDGPGFGYRLDEIRRTLLEPAAAFGAT